MQRYGLDVTQSHSSNSTADKSNARTILVGKFRPALVLVILFALSGIAFATPSRQNALSEIDGNSSPSQEPEHAEVVPVSEVSATSEAHVESATGGSANSSVNVTVNGEKIDVPASGSVQKVVDNGDGQTTVNVTTNQSSNGSSSYVNTNVHSFSTSFDGGQSSVQFYHSP